MKKFLTLFAFICFGLFGQPQAVSIQESYSALNKFNEQKNWFSVIKSANDIMKNYYATTFAKEAQYHLAIAYFNLNDYEVANKYFSKYLKGQLSAKYFDDVMNYKFQIAEKFRTGAKKRVFGWKKGPKIVEADEDALKLYDEVISTLPNSEIAAKSLIGKAKIHEEFDEYKECVESYQQVISRFSKSEFAIQSYLLVGKIYLKQTTPKQQNVDLLDLAEINLQKFRAAFPSEERITEAEKDVLQMKETFAKGLFDTGSFYEKTKKKEAALLYFTKVVNSFPGSSSAKLAEKRLEKLQKKA
ncbi:MAG: tetratricopeptide repeat protein [Chlamydiae bacterium]|nr:tetratricopeptide repeat protein [Chlamydiota bacterium]